MGSIRYTLPYFLGAIKENYIYLKRLLNENRRKLYAIENKIQEITEIRGTLLDNAYSLLNELKNVGVIQNETNLKI